MSDLIHMDSPDRWFDAELSDSYLGHGHQDRYEFAAWVTEYEQGCDPMAPAADPERVQHIWAHGADGADSGRFSFCSEIPGAFPITKYQP